jgi:hypothetical protein
MRTLAPVTRTLAQDVAKLASLLDRALKLLPRKCQVCYQPATYKFRVLVSGSGDVPRDSTYCDQHVPNRYRDETNELEQAELVRDCTKLSETT